jgi:hypothetical protein
VRPEAPWPVTPIRPFMNLNQHGAACRCLLRLLENAGGAGISDGAFIARFLPRHPEWRERPGAADVSTILDLARELGLAKHAEISRDYDRVLSEHRAGRAILVYAERAPEQVESAPPAGRYVMLMVAMNEDAFTLWCPYPSGNSETLPPAKREWWDRWFATGVVFQQVTPQG